MAKHVASISSVTVPAERPERIVDPIRPPAPANDADDPSRFRLTIEATGAGRFVYKVLDRVTGEVIRQLPREEVERMNQEPDYVGGRLVNTAG